MGLFFGEGEQEYKESTKIHLEIWHGWRLNKNGLVFEIGVSFIFANFNGCTYLYGDYLKSFLPLVEDEHPIALHTYERQKTSPVLAFHRGH